MYSTAPANWAITIAIVKSMCDPVEGKNFMYVMHLTISLMTTFLNTRNHKLTSKPRKKSHLLWNCSRKDKVFSDSLLLQPNVNLGLPTVEVLVCEKRGMALVDSRCSCQWKDMPDMKKKKYVDVMTLRGETCISGIGRMDLQVNGGNADIKA